MATVHESRAKIKVEIMSEKSDIVQTPTSTPRRTLGICRRTPKSAPLPSRSAVERPASPLRLATQLTVNNSTQSHFQNTKNENSYATPVIQKRKKLVESAPATAGRTKKSKIGKKLNLSRETSPERAHAATSPNESLADVQKEIKQIEAEIEAMKKHEERKVQLNEGILQWKAGALEALQELQSKIEPKQSITAILDHLRVPHEMFDTSLLEDD